MLAGPDLLVVLAIALVVFGPKKLPELAKTIGKTLGELKKTTDEIKDSMGLKDLGGIKSSLTDMDLFTDLAEKVSASMTSKEAIDRGSEPVEMSGEPNSKKSKKVDDRLGVCSTNLITR